MSEPSEARQSSDQTVSPEFKRAEAALLRSYWRQNVITMLILLSIWAVVGLGCGILFADRLNQFRLPGTGYPLGFWFAQQGSIITFVVLIVIYAIRMNALDASHHRQVDELRHKLAVDAGQSTSPTDVTDEGRAG